MIQPMAAGVSHSCITAKAAQAHSVPTVPGATRGRPEPKPMAMKCAGWDNRKAIEGRRGVAGGMGPAEEEAACIRPECRAFGGLSKTLYLSKQ
ncbi:hypothetical protein GmRootV116_06190 [Variovorax sp. V116]